MFCQVSALLQYPLLKRIAWSYYSISNLLLVTYVLDKLEVDVITVATNIFA
jgi:hypothetical protein